MSPFVLEPNLCNKEDSEENVAQGEEVNNYKGLFYGDQEEEERYFDYGAHFPYKELCRRLEKVVATLDPTRRGETLYEEFSSSSQGIGIH